MNGELLEHLLSSSIMLRSNMTIDFLDHTLNVLMGPVMPGDTHASLVLKLIEVVGQSMRRRHDSRAVNDMVSVTEIVFDHLTMNARQRTLLLTLPENFAAFPTAMYIQVSVLSNSTTTSVMNADITLARVSKWAASSFQFSRIKPSSEAPS